MERVKKQYTIGYNNEIKKNMARKHGVNQRQLDEEREKIIYH